MLTRRDLTGIGLAVTGNAQTPKPTGQAYSLGKALAEREKSARVVYNIMRVPSMRLLIYALAVGEEDKQTPHEEDEIYYVVKGNATLRVEDQEFPVEPGSILYVPAHAVHKFHSITEALETLVFFSASHPK
jgi:mannose-6-phosphate isomerase-like protein (cupin superfamily)